MELTYVSKLRLFAKSVAPPYALNPKQGYIVVGTTDYTCKSTFFFGIYDCKCFMKHVRADKITKNRHGGEGACQLLF